MLYFRLIFSESLPCLDMIEYFLSKSNEFSQTLSQSFNCTTELDDDSMNEWIKNVDYFRLDGQTKKEKRAEYCQIFNDPENKRWYSYQKNQARIQISILAGGMRTIEIVQLFARVESRQFW